MQFRSWALALFVFVFAIGSAVAQTSKGILAGTVRDTTGALIPDAAVTVVNQESGETRNSRTLGDGGYRIEALTAGQYTISSSKDGFNTYKVSDLGVKPSIVTSYDIVLSTGSTSTTVTVEATSAGINTVNGQLAGVIGTAELKALPIFTLNPIELAVDPNPLGKAFVAGGHLAPHLGGLGVDHDLGLLPALPGLVEIILGLAHAESMTSAGKRFKSYPALRLQIQINGIPLIRSPR